jgi:hypothetical protein
MPKFGASFSFCRLPIHGMKGAADFFGIPF